MPAGHCLHFPPPPSPVLPPDDPAKFPTAHSTVHAAELGGLDCPAGQARHCVKRPASIWKLPLAHGEQDPFRSPPVRWVPRGHRTWQTVAAAWLVSPSGQGRHVVWPRPGWKAPTLQGWHVLRLYAGPNNGLYRPGAHILHAGGLL